MRKIIVVCCFLCSVLISAQEYNGTTGLLHVPSAETDSAGTFRGGGMYLDKRFTPAMLKMNGEKYNTFNYFIGFTPWRWLEFSYAAALLKMYKNNDPNESLGYYNEDRRVNVKVTPLYEGRWWPAIAVGMDDVGNFRFLNMKSLTANHYFENLYIVCTKHFDVKGYEIGAHLGYRYYPSDVNKERRGIMGGVTLRPAFYRPLRFIVEWDGIGVNVGADVLLWRHLFIQAALIHGQGFTGGLAYHYTIPF